MNELKDLLIEIDSGIKKLKQEFDDNLYNEIDKKLLELDSLLSNNKIPKSIYIEINKFHIRNRLIHASLKDMNKKIK